MTHPTPLDLTALARTIAEMTEEGSLTVRVSQNADTPVQVAFRTPHTGSHEAFGEDIADALLSAARGLETLPGFEYPPLPGHPLGPHDAIVVRRGGTPLISRLVWVHHSQRTSATHRRGEVCRENDLSGHTLLVDKVEGLTVTPAVTCTTCGRMGWISDGSFLPILTQSGRRRDRRHADVLASNAQRAGTKA